MSFFDKLKAGLSKSKNSFDEKMNSVFSGFRKVDEELLEELEEVLIMSDVGTETSLKNNMHKRLISLIYKDLSTKETNGQRVSTESPLKKKYK